MQLQFFKVNQDKMPAPVIDYTECIKDSPRYVQRVLYQRISTRLDERLLGQIFIGSISISSGLS